MKKEASAEAIQVQLEKIVNSRTFSRSDSNQRLLTYLTKATLKGENPKEYTIGLDVFKRPANDSSNSNVRVYIHKLRKKLEKYYEDEGMNDPVFFSLPSGAYTIHFSTNRVKTNNKKYLYLTIFLLALLNIGTLLYVQLKRTPLQKLSKTTFWNELLINEKPTALIAGDYFFFNKKLKDHRHANIRDTHINSELELRDHVSENNLNLDEYKVTKDLAYMPRDALFSMPEIIPVLKGNKVNYSMFVSSDFDWKIFKEQNLIYIGSMKNLKDLIVIFEKLNLRYDKNPEQLFYHKNGEVKVLDIAFSPKKTIDPTVVIRIPGPNGNIIHLFVSNHDIGCISATKFFTNLKDIQGFEEKYLKNTPYFMAIFKAEGIGRTDISFELIEFQAISDEKLNALWN